MVDLNPRFAAWGLVVRPQGDRPTCSIFTMVAAIEYARASVIGAGTPLSVDYLNWAVRRLTGRPVDGGLFSEAWEAWRTRGACPESALSYGLGADPAFEPDPVLHEAALSARAPELALHWIKVWDLTTGLGETELDAVLSTLDRGHPVCGGFRWPRQQRWTDGLIEMCEPDEVYDGHSVLLCGYRRQPEAPGGGVVLIRNSGGPHRHGLLPFAFLRAYMNDAVWISPAVDTKASM